MSATIEVNDVCAVEHISIPIPEEGGIVVLRGVNGSGKSSTLRAVERLATGKDLKLSPRDGAPRGEVSGRGVTLRVAKSITRVGELECESLDGKLSVAELVDPGLKGADEADSKRIRALVQLAGVKPDVNMFAGLLDNREDFDAVVKGKNLETDDILVLADRIKRAIDEAARLQEGVANVEQAKAAACREASAGIKTDVETDDTVLHKLLEAAICHEQDLRTRSESAIQQNIKVASARSSIELARNETASRSAESLRILEDDAKQSMLNAQKELDAKREEKIRLIAKLDEELTDAATASTLADERWQSVSRELATAEQFELTIKDLQEVVAAGEVAGPTEQELADAADAVANCRASIDLGVLARRAKEQNDKAKAHASAEIAASQKALSLREAAKRVDDVLSEQIAKLGVALQVKAGRLVTKTKRGSTLYADLSDGERWKIAIDIATEAVDFDGMLFIPQTAYEGLDPSNRRLINEHLKKRKVVLLTAESSDGPIRAEVDNFAAV